MSDQIMVTSAAVLLWTDWHTELAIHEMGLQSIIPFRNDLTSAFTSCRDLLTLAELMAAFTRRETCSYISKGMKRNLYILNKWYLYYSFQHEALWPSSNIRTMDHDLL
jgi:hypothetical protein